MIFFAGQYSARNRKTEAVTHSNQFVTICRERRMKREQGKPPLCVIKQMNRSFDLGRIQHIWALLFGMQGSFVLLWSKVKPFTGMVTGSFLDELKNNTVS